MCRYGTHTHCCSQSLGAGGSHPLLPFTPCLAHSRRSVDAPSVSVSVGDSVTGLTQQKRGALNPTWEPLVSLSPTHLTGAQDRAGAPFPAQRELQADGDQFTGSPLRGRLAKESRSHFHVKLISLCGTTRENRCFNCTKPGIVAKGSAKGIGSQVIASSSWKIKMSTQNWKAFLEILERWFLSPQGAWLNTRQRQNIYQPEIFSRSH